MQRIPRIAPSARLEAQIAELLSEGLGDADKLAELGRLGARLVLQRAVEDEVTSFLGRARYQRTAEAVGSRNGTRPKRVQTAEGEIRVDMPQIRDATERFISRVFPDHRTVLRTRPLEALIIGGYVRGLSDRDIEAALAEALGAEAALSRSTASRICQRIKAEFDEWKRRDLSGVRLDYLFLDASDFKMHDGAPAELVLAAWASTPTASRCWWVWRRRHRSPPTPGTTSSPTSSAEG